MVKIDQVSCDFLPDDFEWEPKHLQKLLQNHDQVILTLATRDDCGDDCEYLTECINIRFLVIFEDIVFQNLFKDVMN